MQQRDKTTTNRGVQQEAEGCERERVGRPDARSDNQWTKGRNNTKQQPINGGGNERQSRMLWRCRQRHVATANNEDDDLPMWRQAHDVCRWMHHYKIYERSGRRCLLPMSLSLSDVSRGDTKAPTFTRGGVFLCFLVVSRKEVEPGIFCMLTLVKKIAIVSIQKIGVYVFMYYCLHTI